MPAPRHLVTVWNPSYAADAMDAHLRVLLRQAADAGASVAAGEHDADDPHVWWAKLRSQNRQQPLPHRAEVLALQEQVERDVETHLYLTDYRSLYVAHIGEITERDVLADPDEQDRWPEYYRAGPPADFWFLLWDIRRLVPDDTLEVVETLKGLRNVHYNDRPVSLYGGMVNLPLVVTAERPRAWFDGTDALTEGRLWAERDAALRSETPRLMAELRDNLLGARAWATLEPATRTFLATAEAIFRPHRGDAAYDYSGAAVEYAKAVETELNALVFAVLRRALAQAPLKERLIRLENATHDVRDPVRHQTLGQLRTLLEHEPTVRTSLRSALSRDGDWLVGTLPSQLAVLEELRNPAAHSVATAREQVGEARETVLGIGCEGLIVKLAAVRRRAG
jgi:hypothetical protein